MTVSSSNDTLTYKGSDGQTKEAQGVALVGVNMGAPADNGLSKVTVTTTAALLSDLLAAATPAVDLAAKIAAGVTAALVTVEGNAIRVRLDGISPDATTGLKFAAENPSPYAWDWAGLASIRVIALTGNATLNIALVK